MTFQHKENSGLLFPNKKTKDTQPDFTGEAFVDGVVWRMSAWKKSGKSGTFLSISFQPPMNKSEMSGKTKVPDEDIPF